MKSSEVSAATLVRGLFNSRALRAASLLPVFGAGTLLAAETARPAAKATAPAQKIEPTVVVASRTEEKLADVSPAISVVDADEIRLKGYATVSDALQGQQGVYAAQSGGVGAQTSIFTRGNNSKSTAFLLDGRRLNPGFGGSYEITRYTTDNLDSVQINRGASSTLYGANAIGGVVDLRSVDPLAVKTNGGSAEVEAGSFGLVRGKMQVAGNTDNSERASNLAQGLGASVGASITDTQNDRPNSDFRQVSVLPRVDYRISDLLTADVVSQYSRSRLGMPGDSGGVGAFDPDDFAKDEGFLVSPGLKFDNKDDLKAQVFYSATNTRTDGLNSNTFAVTNYTYVMQKNEVTALAEYSPEKHVKISAGYTYDNAYFRTNSAFASTKTGTIESNSPWARLTVYPIENLTLGAGVRYDDYNRFHGKDAYEGFGSYRIAATDTTVHARVSSAYRAPSPGDFAFGTVGKLSPEESVSYEAGVKQVFFSDKVHLGATVYDNELSNLIGFYFDPVTFATPTYNIDRARTRGVEISGDWTPEKHVKFFANADCMEAVSLSNTAFGEQAGQRLVRRPDWTATAGVEVYPEEYITLGFSTTFVHGREDAVYSPPTFARTQVDMGNYILGRVYANWRVNDHFDVFGRVENIFDDSYESAAVGFESLPLGAYAGVRVRF